MKKISIINGLIILTAVIASCNNASENKKPITPSSSDTFLAPASNFNPNYAVEINHTTIG
ncbi:MAG TPA: hypothetical protein VIM07_07770 [Chitinophagaceae bacterium]|jgi:predicted lipoprotein